MRHRATQILLLALPALLAGAIPATAPAWRTPDVRPIRSLNLTHFQCGEGMHATRTDGGLVLSVTGRAYSDLLLAERIDYSENLVLRIDVPSVTNGDVTLQAVCYDADGNVSKYCDLLENFAAGTYEFPLRIYRTPLRGAKSLGLRVWLAGDKPAATISSVSYGVTP